MTVQPLTGIRVIDLTRVLSGPFSTMLLADMGADVIKIETPQGDTVRARARWSKGLSWYFASFNRNKRSVVIDLRQGRGQAVLATLSPAPTCWSRISALACSPRWASIRRASMSSTRALSSPRSTASARPGPMSTARRSTSSRRRCRASWRRPASQAAHRCGPAPPITRSHRRALLRVGVVNALRARDLTGRGQRVEAAMVNGMV